MGGKINIVMAVDVIAALSNRSLDDNLHMMDDGPLPGKHQGTSHLVTYCWPGWEINWTIRQVDLQTPVAIRSIRFKALDPCSLPRTEGETREGWTASGDLEAKVWSGIVPVHLIPGVHYRYEVLVEMARGTNSIQSVETPSLVVPPE